MAKLLRDIAPRYRRSNGSYRSNEACTGAWCTPQLHVAGLVPPGSESPRGASSVWGLFVRMLTSIIWLQVYWRVYNSLYLGAADALVPFYPDLGELSEGQNVYDRHPLQMFV